MNDQRTYLADTYALIEIVLGNPRYRQFTQEELIVTDFILEEFYYFCLRYYGPEKAADLLEEYFPLRTRLEKSTLELAGQIRLEHKKENLSYADCVGWALAQQLDIPFLTGDKAFKGKTGVAFVT